MIWSFLRALGAASVLALLSVAWIGRGARAAVWERALDLGERTIAYLDDGRGLSAPRTIEINGQPVHTSVGRTRDGAAQVLDFYQRSYPGAQARFGGAERGLLIALDRGPSSWIERLRDHPDGGLSAELGVIRLVYAARAEDGGTRFLAFWTDRSFDPGRMVSDTGDAPGFDLESVPRPPRARRLIAARERPGPFRLLVYETPLPASAVTQHYATSMPVAGWRAQPGARAGSVETARFVRGVEECTMAFSAGEADGSLVVLVARLSGEPVAADRSVAPMTERAYLFRR